jgi:hypothetical protein
MALAARTEELIGLIWISGFNMNARYSDFKHRKDIGGTLDQGLTINNMCTRRDDPNGIRGN